MRRRAIVSLLLLFLFHNLSGILIAQSGVTNITAITLDESLLINDSYSEAFGSGNGVYLATPDGSPPTNNIPYYLWPGGTQESIDANTSGILNATAPSGIGAWQSTVQPANDGKLEVIFHPDEIFGNGTYTLSDVNYIGWQTNKPDTQTNPDWYINIWLDAGGGNVAFLSGEPYWSNNLNAPANTWNQWVADDTTGGTNEIVFHEPGFACTTFGWLAPANTMPTLDQLIAGSFTWNNVPSQNFLPGCAGTPNPLTTTIDYSVMPILGISIATGNPWAGSFTGLLDALEIRLDHPTMAGDEDWLLVDFESAISTTQPTLEKSFSPSDTTIGSTSTLTFTVTNPNDFALGEIAFVDNLPAGLEVANPANVTGNTCSGAITATSGTTTISLSGGYVVSTCEFSVDVTTIAVGALVNTTDAITTTTLNFPSASGSDTATATINVANLLTPETIVVQPSNLQGWFLGPFGTPPTVGFEVGPGTPPLGAGSYFAAISVPASKQIFIRSAADYANLRLSGLYGLSFASYNDDANGSTNDNNWYINLYISTLGNGTYDCRLDYAPTQATPNTWQTFDAFTGTWSGTGTGCGGFSGTLATFLGTYPNATFNAFSNPAEPAIRFNQGDTASTYVGYIGNIDEVRIAHRAVSDTTWDFEPESLGLVTITANDDTAAENPVDNGQFTVSLGVVNPLSVPITVSYTITGTATNSIDYATLTGTVDIGVGQQTAAIDVIPLDDSDLEGEETVTLTLTTASTVLVNVDDTPATVTITEDEVESTPEVSPPVIATAIPASGSDTASNGLLEQVTELPATGEVPFWRNWLISIVSIMTVAGIVVVLRLRQSK